MSELSNNIQTTYKNVITIYQETANLLQDASSILEKDGYRCLHGNSLGTEHSRDINNPQWWICLLYTSPSPRDRTRSRMPSSA